MLYIRKLFTQDLRDGKQIAFPKEASTLFFNFDYVNNEEDRRITFTFRANFGQFDQHNGKVIQTRLYAAGSESRMDGEVKAFIRDELNAQVNDLLIFKNKGTKYTDFEFMFVPQSNTDYYSLLLSLSGGDNHSIYSFENEQTDELDKESSPLQQIFFGAPGTGKSFAIEKRTKGEDVIRTTFHPDSDYSTFVGAYKPTTKEIPMRDVTGKVIYEDNEPVTENRIIYDFVNQAFLQAYVGAWQKMADNAQEPNKQYLVIEEINRGNCAQIFGDLFQLLDRNDQGFSEYPIKADADMKKQLKKQLDKLTIDNADAINAMYEGKGDIVGQVLSGDILLLPSNLYIWATMNTSDQSLFPIDSAFKRRWDWQYIPIDDAGKHWVIKVFGKEYDWWDFLDKINIEIADTTSSEDKKLGYFFCKTADGAISADMFVSKVIFYLWNDVFKDFQFDKDIFNDTDGSKLSFDKFYKNGENGLPVVQEHKVDIFLTNLGVKLAEEVEDEDEEDEDDSNSQTRYYINGEMFKRKSYFGREITTRFLKSHSDLTFQEIKNMLPDSILGDIAHRGLIVSTDTALDSYARYYMKELFTSSDGVTFRVFKQWTINNIDNIIKFGKDQGFNIEVVEE